jgi:hypothetical protein
LWEKIALYFDKESEIVLQTVAKMSAQGKNAEFLKFQSTSSCAVFCEKHDTPIVTMKRLKQIARKIQRVNSTVQGYVALNLTTA